MIQIIRREPKNFHCLPCGILFCLDEEDKVRAHCEKGHGVPYVKDDFGDVYDSREVAMPHVLRSAGAV